MSFSSMITQIFPPKIKFSEKQIPDLDGKVYIVTGANSGVGVDVARILYSKNGRVYVAARSEEKAKQAIDKIKKSTTSSKGELIFLPLDLADLPSVRDSAHEFMKRESKLHVLFNNAGIMNPPEGSKSAQGYELQLGVNCLGTFLFTKLLEPVLTNTAKTAPSGTVRIVWVASVAAESSWAPKGGVELNNLDYHEERPSWVKYAQSKAGLIYYATEFARRFKGSGVVSVALNPGNLDSPLWRTEGRMSYRFMKMFILNPPILGSLTELFTGLSSDVTPKENGKYVIPWGRFHEIRDDLELGTRAVEDGGTGIAAKFWEWSEQQVKPYL
ncbi:NAD(P)-binding protein [Hypoxylon sp. NC1633]|nr:NAD(P)-binding protein [Hypoxylon sp. NC1633]